YRPAAASCRVFDKANRNWQLMLDRLLRCLVPSRQSTSRAIVNLPSERRSHFGIVRPRDLFPDRPIRVAEAPGCAEPLGIRKHQDGAVKGFCLLEIGITARGFGTVKSDLDVRAVA